MTFPRYFPSRTKNIHVNQSQMYIFLQEPISSIKVEEVFEQVSAEIKMFRDTSRTVFHLMT